MPKSIFNAIPLALTLIVFDMIINNFSLCLVVHKRFDQIHYVKPAGMVCDKLKEGVRRKTKMRDAI